MKPLTTHTAKSLRPDNSLNPLNSRTRAPQSCLKCLWRELYSRRFKRRRRLIWTTTLTDLNSAGALKWVNNLNLYRQLLKFLGQRQTQQPSQAILPILRRQRRSGQSKKYLPSHLQDKYRRIQPMRASKLPPWQSVRLHQGWFKYLNTSRGKKIILQ